jgi:glycosidase
MPNEPRYPSLLQINTRIWLRELGKRPGRSATLDDIPDTVLDELAAQRFQWVWLLGVWQTGAVGRDVSRTMPEWRREYQALLQDLSDDDIPGSCFAVTGYAVHTDMGGNRALLALRRKLEKRGLKLMLDFIPNHTAPDHPWVTKRPDFYIQGTDADLAREPANWTRLVGRRGATVFAHGRDPHFPGWPDTLQLDYANPALQEAMTEELLAIAELCDGVRCDMAMLVLPDVFERTWGRRPEPFWPRAIPRVRAKFPGFLFMAEVYWDLEWTLQQQGFNYAYDKRLYDRLRAGDAGPVRDHLHADRSFQDRLARFLENHDEPRAAQVFSPAVHDAAAIVTFLSPGLRFFHQGQFEGYTKHVPVHLNRRPAETVDAARQAFYRRLLPVVQHPAACNGDWQLLDALAAWDGNWTHAGIIAYALRASTGERLLVAVNYSPSQGQCRLRLPWADIQDRTVHLKDLMGSVAYDRDGSELTSVGLYLDLPAWGYHVFEVSTIA